MGSLSFTSNTSSEHQRCCQWVPQCALSHRLHPVVCFASPVLVAVSCFLFGDLLSGFWLRKAFKFVICPLFLQTLCVASSPCVEPFRYMWFGFSPLYFDPWLCSSACFFSSVCHTILLPLMDHTSSGFSSLFANNHSGGDSSPTNESYYGWFPFLLTTIPSPTLCPICSSLDSLS